MALASQSGRSSSRRSYMSSRRRPQRRRLLLLLFLVACVVAAGWWWLRDDEAAEGGDQVAATTSDVVDGDANSSDSRAPVPSEITLDPGPGRAAVRPETRRPADVTRSARATDTNAPSGGASTSPTPAPTR
ncbi:MAG: hypothetical protein P8P71_07440, partial [Phycisphaerales bacterium]|nr:hypothetical protein [Phycisphaerales bacterium]